MVYTLFSSLGGPQRTTATESEATGSDATEAPRAPATPQKV
jgi:hypothetical protein